MGLPPHPSPAVLQGPQSSSDPPWVSQPSTRGCPPSQIKLCAQSQAISLQREPVNTSISDLLHSTANVKPHYPSPPPLNRVSDPTFTSGHKPWSPGSTVVCRLTLPPPHFWSDAEGFVLDCTHSSRTKAKKLPHSFFEFAQIYAQGNIPDGADSYNFGAWIGAWLGNYGMF